jgi:hypothetical protein
MSKDLSQLVLETLNKACYDEGFGELIKTPAEDLADIVMWEHLPAIDIEDEPEVQELCQLWLDGTLPIRCAEIDTVRT